MAFQLFPRSDMNDAITAILHKVRWCPHTVHTLSRGSSGPWKKNFMDRNSPILMDWKKDSRSRQLHVFQDGRPNAFLDVDLSSVKIGRPTVGSSQPSAYSPTHPRSATQSITDHTVTLAEASLNPGPTCIPSIE